jgi:arginine deiminase
MEAVTARAIGAYSEVGNLRTVTAHRPDLAHTRLSPRNCHELLMRGRGAGVLLFDYLSAETLERADARERVLERRLRPEEVTGAEGPSTVRFTFGNSSGAIDTSSAEAS